MSSEIKKNTINFEIKTELIENTISIKVVEIRQVPDVLDEDATIEVVVDSTTISSEYFPNDKEFRKKVNNSKYHFEELLRKKLTELIKYRRDVTLATEVYAEEFLENK